MAYEFNGIQYPSVTAITGMLDKPALLGWAARCAVEHIADNLDAIKDPIDVHRGEAILEEAKNAYNVKRDNAADSGTRCHDAIKLYINEGDTIEVTEILGDDENARNGFGAFLTWEKINHVEWISTECEVWSEIVGYAGRFDAIARINGVLYLIDFKTSSGIFDEMRYQVCAYKQAYNEHLPENAEPIENVAILHLDKLTSEPVFYPVSAKVERYTLLFNQLVSAYYLMKDRRLKNNPFAAKAKALS
jgi:hypothetical protein